MSCSSFAIESAVTRVPNLKVFSRARDFFSDGTGFGYGYFIIEASGVVPGCLSLSTCPYNSLNLALELSNLGISCAARRCGFEKRRNTRHSRQRRRQSIRVNRTGFERPDARRSVCLLYRRCHVGLAKRFPEICANECFVATFGPLSMQYLSDALSNLSLS